MVANHSRYVIKVHVWRTAGPMHHTVRAHSACVMWDNVRCTYSSSPLAVGCPYSCIHLQHMPYTQPMQLQVMTSVSPTTPQHRGAAPRRLGGLHSPMDDRLMLLLSVALPWCRT
jgi:hypothetical protein